MQWQKVETESWQDDITSNNNESYLLTPSNNASVNFVSEYDYLLHNVSGQIRNTSSSHAMAANTNFSINYDEDGGGGSPKAPQFGDSNLIVNGD